MAASTLLAFVLLSLCGVGVAQSKPLWNQCGGIGWTGSTTCVAGSTCFEWNDYYAQCIPETVSSTPPASTTTPVTSTPAPTAGSTDFWFSFGDSYTQTGFTPSGTIPTVGNPLGNPPYPGYTAVGGTNWIDLNTVQFNKSLILTYNYAYGGATIDASLVTPYEPTVLSLTDQVDQFLTTVASKPASAPWTSDNSIFSFWIGINDIGNSYYQSGDRDAFSDTLLDAYFALVQKLYDVGARNFLFINVPPIDRSPLMLAQSADAQALEKGVISGFNSKLVTRVSDLKANNAGVTTFIWDSNTDFAIVLDNPATYGFVDATSFGGANDFWGNNYHPSSAAHTIWAEDVAGVLADTRW